MEIAEASQGLGGDGDIQTGNKTPESRTQTPSSVLKGKVVGFQDDGPKSMQILLSAFFKDVLNALHFAGY